MTVAILLTALVLGLPLAGSVVAALTSRVPSASVWAGNLSIGAAFLVAVGILWSVLASSLPSRSTTVLFWNWFSAGHQLPVVGVQFTLDPLSAVMLMVITGVGLLIHIYSIGYMDGDPGIGRFFSYMNFFIFSMVLLVLAANLVFLIIGWALVALSSYLLIGFWYERPSAVSAARKAFITQVIGDVALVIAAFMLVLGLTSGPDGSGRHLYSTSLPTIFAHAASFSLGSPYIVTICILLAIGAFAKSAQFPLHTWLPDAMEGPTPVSALIHAATMVTAGVYLIARFHVLFERAPIAAGMVACVGMGTALMAGVIALSQVDIKRVIAYSTMSQIGLMIYATGIGAYSAAIYHLVMHAIFKALLFMAAGNVIHGMGGEQDIRAMGGMGRRLRLTEACFLSGALSLAGIPLFAGWWSKEGLLGFGLLNGPGAAPWILYLVGVSINVLTGLYIFRLWGMVFRGEPGSARAAGPHAADLSAGARQFWMAAERILRPLFTWPVILLDLVSLRNKGLEEVQDPVLEAPVSMLLPVTVLAVLAACLGIFIQWPFTVAGFGAQFFTGFLQPVFGSTGTGLAVAPGAGLGAGGLIAGTLLSAVGVTAGFMAWAAHRRRQGMPFPVPQFAVALSSSKFYFDELYDVLLCRPVLGVGRFVSRVADPDGIDGVVTWVSDVIGDYSEIVRLWQTGFLRDYAAIMMVFVAVFVLVAVLFIGKVA